MDKTNILQGIIIFCVAVICRLLFLREFSSNPLFNTPIMDMAYHHQWALDILAGQGISYVPFFRAPLYPYVLAGLYTLFGVDFWVVRIVQAFLGSMSAVLVYCIGRQSFSSRSGFIAGFIYAFWGTAIFYDGQLLIPSLTILLNLFALFHLTKAVRINKVHNYLLGGLFLGLSAIARPTVLLFAGVYILWLLWEVFKKKQWVKRHAIPVFILALLVPIIPVTMYNYLQSGQWTIIGTYGGLNFYLGNNRQADGISAVLPGARKDWWGMLDDAERFADEATGKKLTPAEQSTFWLKTGVQEITNAPVRFMGHLLKKTIYFIQGIELSNNFDFYYFARSTFITKALIWSHGIFLPWGLFFPLAVVGFLFASNRNRQSWILVLFASSIALAVVLFFVTARYRLPIAPILALFAAEAVLLIIGFIKNRNTQKLVLTGSVLLPFLFISNIDFFHHADRSQAPGLFTTATIYLQQGKITQAEYYYKLSIAADSTFAQAYNDYGLLLTNQGRIDDALQLMQRGLVYNPDFLQLQYNYSYALLASGYADNAIPILYHILNKEPGNLDSKDLLGWAFTLKKQYDSALVYYREIVNSGLPYPRGYYNLGSTFLQLAMPDSAYYWLQKAVQSDSTNAETYYNLGRVWILRNNPDSAAVYLRMFLHNWRGGSQQAVFVQQLIDSLQSQKR